MTSEMQQQSKNILCPKISDCDADGLSQLATEAIFEWNKEKCQLICFGYLRQFIKIGIADIGSILYKYLSSMLFDYHINNDKYSNIKYMSNNTLLCNYYIKNNNNNDKNIIDDHIRYSTIIFAPFISQIILNHNDNNNNHININYQMKVSLDKRKSNVNDCGCKMSSAFQIGLVCVPIAIMDSHDHGCNCNQFEHILWLNKFSSIYQNMNQFPNDTFCLGNILHREKNNGDKIFDELKVHYLISVFGDQCEISWSKFGYIQSNQDIRFDNRNTNKNDNICVCVDQYCLHFTKNDQIIGNNVTRESNSENDNDDMFSNGNLKLDFEKFDYLFALSSLICNCNQGKLKNVQNGLAFKVSFSKQSII